MKNKSQSNSYAGQSKVAARTSLKHDVNVQKNSVLYFQIGLILCLLGTFGLFEMRFENKILQPEVAEQQPDVLEYTLDKFKVYEQEVKQQPKKKKSTKIIDEIDEKPDNYVEKIEETLFTPDDPVLTYTPIDTDAITVVEVPEENFNIINVQFVPIFPGCEKYELNSERKKCLNDKMGRLVRKKFDTDIAVNYGLSGVQRIFVEFKVDKSGEITDIKTRAPHPKLEEEALRLAHKIPKMEPGKMGTTPVNVIYNLPITFKVQD